MTVNGLITACSSSHHGLQLFCQDVAHTQWVHLDELWHLFADGTHQILSVLQHLSLHVLHGEQRVHRSINGSVDIGRQMVGEIAHGFGNELLWQLIEHIAHGHGVACQQRVNESIACFGEHSRCLLFIALPTIG